MNHRPPHNPVDVEAAVSDVRIAWNAFLNGNNEMSAPKKVQLYEDALRYSLNGLANLTQYISTHPVLQVSDRLDKADVQDTGSR